jgi:hypothetical protein
VVHVGLRDELGHGDWEIHVSHVRI